MSFQENLKFYREKAGYKQAKDFAQILNIPYPTYVGYESKNREPKYEMLCKIADLLKVSTDDLLGRTTNILGNNEDEKLLNLLDDILLLDKKKCITIDSYTKEHIYFYIGTNFKYGKIEINKKRIIDCINKSKQISKEIEQINTFNFLVDEILNTAFNDLENDINDNDKVIKEIKKEPKGTDKEELEKTNILNKIKKTNTQLQIWQNIVLKIQKHFKDVRQEIILKNNK